jgi:hypothetical protein
MTDYLLGAADNYSWKDIRPWVKSARQSGFDGPIFLVCYRIADDIREKAPEYDVTLYEVNHDPYGQPIQHAQRGSPTQAHNLRMYHFWELLTRLMPFSGYDRVIATDVRDVIFQTNPSRRLNHYLKRETDILAPSEGIMYRDEPWNKENLIQGFGQIYWELAGQYQKAYNVGTIAGGAIIMAHVCGTIFRMTEGRYYPSDQSSWNYLIYNVFAEFTQYATHENDWACQLGTTMDPTKAYLWDKLCEPRPEIIENKFVVSSNGVTYSLVHQWDRVPELRAYIEEKYRD